MLHSRDLVGLEQLRQSHFGYRLATPAGKHERATAVVERTRRVENPGSASAQGTRNLALLF
ncbi:MAG: hypothetical protein OXI93_11865 [Bryobacterales bacterium]|nr:hypothetical protein [Bryobacterales bacterium]